MLFLRCGGLAQSLNSLFRRHRCRRSKSHSSELRHRLTGLRPERVAMPSEATRASDRPFTKEISMSSKDPTWISDWNPEDPTFWETKGKVTARRNLIWSIVAEHIGFSVWLIWSIVATKLPAAGFHYTTDELFQLVAIPGLIGSLMRFPYTFAVTTFGGRNWTIFSASVLFIPTFGLAYFVSQPRDAVLADAAGGFDRRSRRRQLRLQHGQYLLLLSRPHEGLGARPQRRRRQYRRQQRSADHADPDGRRPYQSLPGNAGLRRLSPERRADVGDPADHRGVRRHLSS